MSIAFVFVESSIKRKNHQGSSKNHKIEMSSSITILANSAEPNHIRLSYNIIAEQSMLITTNVVSSNPVHGEMYLIQHYVIKFVSDLQKVGGVLWILQFSQPIKLIPMILL
jgi:hypothetical protein